MRLLGGAIGSGLPPPLLFEILLWVAAVVLLPVSWAGIEALAAGVPWHRALGRSVGRAVRHWRLTAVYLIVSKAVSYPARYLPGLWPRSWEPPWSGPWLLEQALRQGTEIPLEVAALALETVALVVVYREMVWRDRLRADLEQPG
jgi:hypothetical protein